MLPRVVQMLLGLLSSLALGLVAGAFLSSSSGFFSTYYWLPLLVPPLFSFRGAIIGLFQGRLSTGLNIGIMNSSITRNTEHFYGLLVSMYLLRMYGLLTTSLLISLVLLLKIGTLDKALESFIVLLAVMEASIDVTWIVCMGVSKVVTKYGLDPDCLLYPIGSSVADAIINASFYGLLIAYYVVGLPIVALLIPLITFTYMAYIIRKVKYNKDEVRRTVKESILSLTIVSFIVSMSSAMFSEIAYYYYIPAIAVAYPAFIDTLGDVGSAFGSVSTTQLHLGLPPPYKSKRLAARLLLSLLTAYIPTNLLIGLYPFFTGALSLYENVALFVPRLLASGLIAISLGILIVSYIVDVTFKKGLDPDHFVNPIISTLSDCIGTFSILLVFRI